jgi:hypothetical protein
VFKKNNIEVFPVIVPASNKLKSYNFFLVENEQSLLLIDTGLNNDDCWDSLQRVLKNNDLIKKRIKELDEKASQYINMIKSGITTASELAKHRYNERYEKQFFSIMSQVIGYLDYIELQGKIKKEMEKGIWQYYL